ncbi:MAG: ribonuclease P protein component [Bacilli bacterium]|nr:ribonuclease P protein component [Bacilli bacterium]
MKKINIVKKNQDFSTILNNRKKIGNKYLVIYYKENNLSLNRYGISVSKKLGNAVTRNKIKRQVKNIIDKNENLFKKNQDYIIIIRKDFIDLKFESKEQIIKNLISTNEWR